MRVRTFVSELSEELGPQVFHAVCADAKAGKMGFGRTNSRWGDGKGKV